MTGGPQGSGVDSSANIFAGACALSGLWTFGSREYYSSIKGPHSYFEVRANSERIRSQINNVNLLATFDAETLIRHADEVCPGGGIIYDPTFSAVEIAKGLPKQSFSYQLKPIQNQPRLLLMGNEAVALGKIVGGCRVQTYYPITPAADESEFIESHENFDLLDGGQPGKKGSVLVTQTEDEIAAITMAIGAALAGARAATSTSGPGFSLIVEGLGWAGMNEVPVVITQYSRGGPSTGQPTRHEQGDLKFVLSASHGEFPRIVLCSGDLEECFYDAIRIFNYAEQFQMPSIHLIDKSLANSSATIPQLRSDMVPIQRGKLINDGHQSEGNEEYHRFAFSDDGVSPRAVLGMPGYRFWNSGDEHDTIGHIEEDPDNRIKMM